MVDSDLLAWWNCPVGNRAGVGVEEMEEVMACSMCHGTDAQDYCTQGQCYWEQMRRQEEEYDRLCEEECQREMEEHYRKHPHG